MYLSKPEREAVILLQDLAEKIKPLTDIDRLQAKLRRPLESRRAEISDAVWRDVLRRGLFAGEPLGIALKDRFAIAEEDVFASPSPKRQKQEASAVPEQRVGPLQPPSLPFQSGWEIDVSSVIDLCRYKLSDVFLFGPMLFLVSEKTHRPIYHIPGTNASQLLSFASPYGRVYYCLLFAFLPAYVIFSGTGGTFFFLSDSAYKAMPLDSTCFFSSSLESHLSSTPDFESLSCFSFCYDDGDYPLSLLTCSFSILAQVTDIEIKNMSLHFLMVSKFKHFKFVVEHKYEMTQMEHVISTYMERTWSEDEAMNVSCIHLSFCLALQYVIDMCTCDYMTLQAERDSAITTINLMEIFRHKIQSTLKSVLDLIPQEANRSNQSLLEKARQLAEI